MPDVNHFNRAKFDAEFLRQRVQTFYARGIVFTPLHSPETLAIFVRLIIGSTRLAGL